MAYTDKQRIMDYRLVFKSEAGRRVLSDLVKRHGVFKPATELDPYALAYHAGERDVVMDILGYMDMKPEDVETRETLAEVTA